MLILRNNEQTHTTTKKVYTRINKNRRRWTCGKTCRLQNQRFKDSSWKITFRLQNCKKHKTFSKKTNRLPLRSKRICHPKPFENRRIFTWRRRYYGQRRKFYGKEEIPWHLCRSKGSRKSLQILRFWHAKKWWKSACSENYHHFKPRRQQNLRRFLWKKKMKILNKCF